MLRGFLDTPLVQWAQTPVASPPPPYSPRRDGDQTESSRNLQTTLSPSDTVSPSTDVSQYGTPVSAATTMSPDTPLSSGGHRSPPTRGTYYRDESNVSCSATPAFPPPPPAAQAPGLRVRSTSKSHAERLLSTLGSKAKPPDATPPPSAIDALQLNTAQALAQTPEAYWEPSAKPPASRRAASTGGIGLGGSASRTSSRSTSQNRWEPGMPLPPPPPGPPPTASRSQSLNRSLEVSPAERISVIPSRSRRPPGNGTALAPVPPTPADWNEGRSNTSIAVQPALTARHHAANLLHIDTGVVVRDHPIRNEEGSAVLSANPYSAHLQSDSTYGTLSRSPAVRDRSAKGIRERRSESRNGKGRAIDMSNDIQLSTITVSPESLEDVKPTDLILPAGGSGFSRRRAANRLSPASGKIVTSLNDTLRSPHAAESTGKPGLPPGNNNTVDRSRSITPTPPFSPSRVSFVPDLRNKTSPSVPPKISPPSQLQRQIEGQQLSSLNIPSALDERPISHLLHIPNADESVQEPLLPFAQVKRKSMADLLGPESPMAFAQRATERHRIFAEREANASSDSERLDLFIQFMVAESRIRREQYASLFEEEEIMIEDLTKGLFERQTKSRLPGKIRSASPKEELGKSVRDSRTSSISDSANESSWHRSSSIASRTHESSTSATTDCSSQNRPESSWWKDYVPCLSPIASMSIATGQDHEEKGSRGRSSSRWWEEKSGQSAVDDAFSVLKKSKRESKYMGVSKEARDSPAPFETTPSRHNDTFLRFGEGVTRSEEYALNEYPREKVGWHQQSSPLPPPPLHPPTPLSAPFTPDPRKLDISRFVTLPPPFPRHHPAVNNSHPELAEIRAVVRSLHETEEADAIRLSYATRIGEKRTRADSWRQHQRSLHDQEMRFRVDHEELSQEEFDLAQSELDSKIKRSEKEITQTDFDFFQSMVVSPLHALYSERIANANKTIEELNARIFSDAQKQSPNLPQEEGDEQPELLEKLTQLKWLFEARENLHRRTYDLLSERNEKYRAIVLLPYRQCSNHDKAAEAERFFASDARDRMVVFGHEVSSRFDAFVSIIEANVTRGVEVQLSAFWDIAPPLHRVLSRVPDDLRSFEIQIPVNEYAENPEYDNHPLQYLYSLLAHAQKSTYQFIESQVNLLCLLHEIKNAAMNAKYQAQEHQGQHYGTRAALDDGRRMEEARLTEDLKDKVAVIEGQWEEALGEELMAVRERAERVLRQQERRRPPAATAIQKTWRGYRVRKDIRNKWRREWDAREAADKANHGLWTGTSSDNLPYAEPKACLSQLTLLIHFASPRESSDHERLKLFAQRFCGLRLESDSAYPSEIWTFSLLRLGELTISVLSKLPPSTLSDNVNVLLRLLSTLAEDIPEQMAFHSAQYFEALKLFLPGGGGNGTALSCDKNLLNKSVVSLLVPSTPRTADAYQGFASHFLIHPEIPLDTLRLLLDNIRMADLRSSLNDLLSSPPPRNLLQHINSEGLLWLVAYFIYFHRTKHDLNSRAKSESDALYVAILSRLISHLAVEISLRIDVSVHPMATDSDVPQSPSLPLRGPLPPFIHDEISSLVGQDHVSGLLGQAAVSSDPINAASQNQPSTLAVYALTLLRAFPQRGDEIRMWLYLGSTAMHSDSMDTPIPAIKYYFNAASQTSIYRLIRDEPRNAIGLLNPNPRKRAKIPSLPDRDEQWQIVLLFLELYPIVLKVMDDEEFLGGSVSTESTGTWTRRSALPLDHIKDLTVFLKNLAFSMYWNASEIAGIEEPENKNSIAEYFSGNLSAIADNHPDAKPSRPRDVMIAGLPGMTMSYMKGMVTGLLRMIYERDSRRRFFPSDHWLMTQWFEMDRFIPAVVQEEEEKHKIQESYGTDTEFQNEEELDEDAEAEDEIRDTLIGTQRTQQVRNLERLRRQQRKASRRKFLETVTPRLEILQNMPFFIPFATRVQIFRHFVLLDQVRRRGTADAEMWRFSMMNSGRPDMGKHRAKVRRESIFDDAFKQFYELGEGLKEPIQISFVDKFDTVEEGIDGGGVTKEFLTSVTSEAFNSMSGLDMFVENDQHLLYPNPTALEERKELLHQAGETAGTRFYNDSVRDLLRRFEFMGRIIGKCLYEGILVDIHFAPFFLLKWSLTGGHTSATRESGYRANLNDLRDLDEALYQGLLQLKNYQADDNNDNSNTIDSLALTFEVTDTLFPTDRPSAHPSQNPIPRTVELRPNGANIPVTNANRLVYISYIARHRLSIQPFHQTSAFLRGLGQIVSPAWLSMFNQHELQTLISGSAASIDIADLRRNTQYGGLYVIGDDGLEHPTIQLFWSVVESFSTDDQMKLVKFVTSTPRAPLLGFGNLNPRFSIRDAGRDEARLPTTSTCVNLLKLPVFKEEGVLRERLLYSIRAGAGFNLS
ncbi:MAG: hypothetical protein Q9219_004123 [cf. Caloplaca sp. 3 TL-2023]